MKVIMMVKKKKRITYRINFIASYRFMPSKVSDLIDYISEIYNTECKSCMDGKKILGRNVNLLDLKMADWITNAKNVEKNALS